MEFTRIEGLLGADWSVGLRRRLHDLAVTPAVMLLAIAYSVTALASLRLAVVDNVVTPLWPPTGVAVVALLVFGYRLWPGITIAAFLVNIAIAPSVAAAGGIAIGNTLAPVFAVFLLRQVSFRNELDRLRDALALVFLGALVAMVVSATIGTLSLILSGSVARSSFGDTWWAWWTGDAMGVLVFAPLLLGWRRRPIHDITRARAGEAVLLFTGLAVVARIVLWSHLPVIYLVFPFLMWAALRFGLHGAAVAVVMATTIAVWAAVMEAGIFAGQTLFTKMVTLQVYNATIALTTFVLTSILAERNSAKEALLRSRSELEMRVQERTSELIRANEQLAREVTDRSHAEAELRRNLELVRKADAEQRRLHTQLLSAHEEERERIASDLHDDPIQKMTALALRLERLHGRLDDPDKREAVAHSLEMTSSTIGRLRRLVFLLRPPSLEDEGLGAAISEHLRSVTRDTGLRCRVLEQMELEPPVDVRSAAYRIAVEAITNVEKHARASSVTVHLESEAGGVHVRIVDDGVGPPPHPTSPTGHLGLTSMEERAQVAGGWWRFGPGKGAGSEVEYWLPVPATARSAPG